MVNSASDDTKDRTREGAGAVQVPDRVLQIAARLASSMTAEERIVLVTGYEPGDGADDLAAQLAVGLASVSHEQVALVDADRSSAGLHELFRVPARPGLGELLEQESDLSAAQRHVAAGVSLIPLGDMRRSAPIADCARVCQALRARFRFVVISAGTLLDSAEAVAFGAVSDGGVLALSAGRRSRDEIQELQREAARLRLRLLGAVLREGK